MRNLSLLKSIIYLTLLIIGIISIVVFIIWGVLNVTERKWLGWGVVIGVSILALLIALAYKVIKDFGKPQTKLTVIVEGIVDSKLCDEKEKWRDESSPIFSLPMAGHSPWKETYFVYSIKVNGISFQINRDTWDQLSEGDEVCVSYWPNSKRVSSVVITKKVDQDTAKQIREKKREEAIESWRKSRNERHKTP